jgi:hypothetical protein
MKEEYIEGFLEIPKISEETLPEQLKELYNNIFLFQRGLSYLSVST